jgi:hypothetical protein
VKQSSVSLFEFRWTRPPALEAVFSFGVLSSILFEALDEPWVYFTFILQWTALRR